MTLDTAGCECKDRPQLVPTHQMLINQTFIVVIADKDKILVPMLVTNLTAIN